MKIITKILGIREHKVGTSIFHELVRLFPDGLTKNGFQCILPIEDPRVAAILRVLQNGGWRPANSFTIEDQTFILEYERIYELEDYLQAEYLVPKPQVSFGGISLDRKTD